MDWAGIIPVLAAGVSGKPDVVSNTVSMLRAGREDSDEQKLRLFGRLAFGDGMPTAEKLSFALKESGAPPEKAAIVSRNFMEMYNQKEAERRDYLIPMQGQEGAFTKAQLYAEEVPNYPGAILGSGIVNPPKQETQWIVGDEGKTFQNVPAGPMVLEGGVMPMEAYRSQASEGYPFASGSIGIFDRRSGEIIERSPETSRAQTPYYTPVQTSSGLLSFDNRTGSYSPMQGEGGPLLPVAADPSLAGEKKTAEKTAEAAVEKKTAFPKVRNSMTSLNAQWDIVEKQVDKAIGMVGPFTAGAGAWARIIPATPQKNLSATLDTIRANIGFDKLQDMRANSPTGGALGAVSDMENRLLQSVKGSIDQNQSPSQLIENLKTIKADLQRMRAEKEFAYRYDYRDFLGEEGSAEAPTGLGESKFKIIGVE